MPAIVQINLKQFPLTVVGRLIRVSTTMLVSSTCTMLHIFCTTAYQCSVPQARGCELGWVVKYRFVATPRVQYSCDQCQSEI
jgi:hypothetical protein